MKKSILLIITLFMVTRVFAQNAYSPEMLKAFADDLYVQGFWDEAESEYKRYFFAVNNAAIDDNSVLNLSHIYFQEKNKTGIEWINNNLKKSCGFAVQSRLEYIDASFMFRERNAGAWHLFYGSLLERTEYLEKLSPEWKILYALSLEILEKNIKLAAETANKGTLYSSSFASVAVACENYNQKSGALALCMSALVPGTGKWYSGNFWTGLSDFFTIGSCTAAAVYYGKQKGAKDWRPWTYGSLAALFYIVDLYGSYTGTRRYNSAQYNNLCVQVDNLYEQLY